MISHTHNLSEYWVMNSGAFKKIFEGPYDCTENRDWKRRNAKTK